MRKYLVEGVAGGFEFIVDRTQPFVTESKPAGGGPGYTRIPGRFSVCDCVNGNNRRYRKNVWEKNLQEGSILQESIKKNAAFGLLEHPKDGIVTLLSPISHLVTKAEMVESTDPRTGKAVHEVVGEISLVNTPEGKKLAALIEAGYNPLVSSRGYGSLEKAPDGVDEVLEDYVCESWDVVIKPSFEQAELTPSRQPLSTEQPRMAAPATAQQSHAESKEESNEAASLVEALGHPRDYTLSGSSGDQERRMKDMLVSKIKAKNPNITPEQLERAYSDWRSKHQEYFQDLHDPAHPRNAEQAREWVNPLPQEENLKANPSTGAATAVPRATENRNKVMSQEIRSRIVALESVDPKTLNAQRFAESMASIEEVHQAVAEYQAENPKATWEATKMHRQLDAIASKFSESAAAPGKAAKKLHENNTKLMRVINAVAGTAVTYKKKLSEAVSSDAQKTKLVEELTTRGRGWQKLAESRKATLETKESDLNTACEALDIMAKRYHEDTTHLGRRVLQLEFSEALAEKPELQKRLKEAKRLRQVLAIREELEGKKAVNEEGSKDAGVGKPTDGEDPGKEAMKGAKKGDKSGKGEKVADEPGEVTNESKGTGKSTVTEGKEESTPKAEKRTEGKVLLRNTNDPRSLSESVAMVQRLSSATK